MAKILAVTVAVCAVVAVVAGQSGPGNGCDDIYNLAKNRIDNIVQDSGLPDLHLQKVDDLLKSFSDSILSTIMTVCTKNRKALDVALEAWENALKNVLAKAAAAGVNVAACTPPPDPNAVKTEIKHLLQFCDEEFGPDPFGSELAALSEFVGTVLKALNDGLNDELVHPIQQCLSSSLFVVPCITKAELRFVKSFSAVLVQALREFQNASNGAPCTKHIFGFMLVEYLEFTFPYQYFECIIGLLSNSQDAALSQEGVVN